NNKIGNIASILIIIYHTLNHMSKAIDKHSDLSDDEKLAICIRSYESLGNKNVNKIVYDNVVKIKENINELIILGQYIDPFILRKLTQLQAYDVYKLMILHELNMFSSTPGPILFNHLNAIAHSNSSIQDFFKKKYSIYKFEY